MPRPHWSVSPPAVIAHRGASAEAPENTLASFRRALELGAPAVELDVHLTRDGTPVVIHDDEVDRTTSGSGLVRDLPLEEIRRLDAGTWFDPAFAGERVPTLAEVLSLVRGKALVNVEIKAEERLPPGLVEATVREVHAAGMAEDAAFTSFHPEAVRAVRAVAPRAHTGGILLGEPDAESLAPFRGAAGAIGFPWEAATPQGIAAARSEGLAPFVWTLNDPRESQRLWSMGVVGIITDDPAAMLAKR